MVPGRRAHRECKWFGFLHSYPAVRSAAQALGTMKRHAALTRQGQIRQGAGLLLLIAIALADVMRGAAAQTPNVPEPDSHARSTEMNRLHGGWYLWDPYQYHDYRRGVQILTGFDVEIERTLQRLLGMEILLPEIAWQDQLAAVADGTMDITAGTIYSDARNAYAYFSNPYRTETPSCSRSSPTENGQRATM